MLAVGYLTGAVLVALAVFAAGRAARRRDARGPSRPLLTGLVAGLVWPVFLVGIAQFALLFALSRTLRWFFGTPGNCRPVGGVSRPAAAFTDVTP